VKEKANCDPHYANSSWMMNGLTETYTEKIIMIYIELGLTVHGVPHQKSLVPIA